MEPRAPTTTSGTGEAGFTLVELLIVLAIIALFTGAFVMRFEDTADERLLREVSGEIREMAHAAKDLSFAYRRDHWIVFGEAGFHLTDRMPLPGTSGAAPDDRPVSLPEGVVMQIRREGDRSWRDPDGIVWRFRRSGLSDPLVVRFARGDSFVSLDFPALTGRPAEVSVFR